MPKYLEVSPADLEKLTRNRAKAEAYKIDGEQLFIAEFGKHYGWGGVQAILNNEIDGDTAVWLLQAARKIDYSYLRSQAQAVLIGSGAAQSKNPGQVFKKATSEMSKAMKADI